HAATAVDVDGGAYIGPAHLCETRGYPADARIPLQARDVRMGKRLWENSEKLYGVRYLVPPPAPGSRRRASRDEATFGAL
ncbi:short-chain dehydrogenase, partial [Burkholderia pseudomallei]